MEELRAESITLGAKVRALKESGKDVSYALNELKLCKQQLSDLSVAALSAKQGELSEAQARGDSGSVLALEAEISVIKSGIIEDKAAKKKREKAEKAAKAAKSPCLQVDNANEEGLAQEEGKEKPLSKKELNKLKKRENRNASKNANEGEQSTTTKVLQVSGEQPTVQKDQKQSEPYFSITANVVSRLTGLNLVNIYSNELDIGDGEVFRGDLAMSQYLARRAASEGRSQLYGESSINSVIAAKEIDQWLEFSQTQVYEFGRECTHGMLNKHLLTRTFIVGHSLSLADISVWAAIVSSMKGDPVNVLSKNNSSLIRWAKSLEETNGFAPVLVGFLEASRESAPRSAHPPTGTDTILANEDIKFARAETTKCSEKKNAQAVPRLPPLKNAKDGEVVTRFPPEPSGHLHIGHVKALFLNKFYAERYSGRMLLRLDDTNPTKEKLEYEEGIKQDIISLGVEISSISHTSDHFDLIIKYAVQLITEGNAYIENATQEEMSAMRMKGEDTPARAASDKSLCVPLFFAMVFGPEGATQCENYGVSLTDSQKAFLTANLGVADKSCLRAKIDQATRDQNFGNKALFDPVFFRPNLEPHARTGKKYRAYPTYDFACPIVDSHEGVTHAMRDFQYRDRAPLYDWVFRCLRIRPVNIHDFSRMNFQFTLLSKRKLKWFVDNGRVNGWDDARFPTVKGVIRRGMHVDALFDFMIAQGASKHVVDMEWDKFWNLNKKYIDPVAPRFNAISKDGFMRINMFCEDGKTPFLETSRDFPLLPKDTNGEKFGFKKVLMNRNILVEAEDLVGPEVDCVRIGDKIVLLNWGVCEVTKLVMEAGKISSIEAKIEPGGDFRKPKKKIQWVAESPNNTVIVLHEFDFLVKNSKAEGDKENPDAELLGSPAFLGMLRETTEATTELIGEPAIANLKDSQCLQLQRRGYFRLDHRDAHCLHLFMIPDGKQKAMSTLSTKLDHR